MPHTLIGTAACPPWRAAAIRPFTLLAALALLVGLAAGGAPRARGAVPPGYTPDQFLRAYDVLPLHQHGWRGRGETIALMEVDGVARADLARFDQVFHLPPVRLELYVPQGSTQQLAPGPETTMDVEYAHALAPDARIQVYEVRTVGDFQGYSRHLGAAIAAAIDHGATVVSISLRGTGSILCSTFWAAVQLHPTLKAAAQRGVTVFAASGDYGDRKCQGHSRGTVYPASDPAVTAVGGTRLALAPDGGYGGETAWSESGGGNTTDFNRPAWQVGRGSLDPTYRSVPDVAWDADPQTGAVVYLQGRWLVEGGTSLGAPCWAALWAIAAQYHRSVLHRPLGWANPLLYALATSPRGNSVFHDVTSGSNGYYEAGPGWDAVTGWGSPDAARLVRALSSR
ncbi:MAG: hypothetical protein NVSMB65_12620 [Chloroflexota bacterium]